MSLYRKRKLTDKALPNVILQNPNFAQDSQMYQDLLDMERKLDWTMMRKRVEVQDALARNPTVCTEQQTLCQYYSDSDTRFPGLDDANTTTISEPHCLWTAVADGW